MKHSWPIWTAGLIGTLAVIALPVFYFWPPAAAAADDPWAGVPQHPVHTSHADLLAGPYATGQDVTRACLECHPQAAGEVRRTTHWTWESQPVTLPGRTEPATIGKKNQINNFCIGIQGNWKKCTTCHTGYGWQNAGFDFADAASVDCLACHAEAGLYAKGEYGNPAPEVNLAAAAQSVGLPTRENCGACHF